MKKAHNVGGKNPLTIYQVCVDTGVESPHYAGRVKSVKQLSYQKQTQKRK